MQIPSVTATRDELVEFFSHGTDDQVTLWAILNNVDVDLAAPLPRDVVVLSAIALSSMILWQTANVPALPHHLRSRSQNSQKAL